MIKKALSRRGRFLQIARSEQADCAVAHLLALQEQEQHEHDDEARGGERGEGYAGNLLELVERSGLRVADLDRNGVIGGFAARPRTAVAPVLEPIWVKKRETASRVRARIERVLDWAKVHGYREAGA